METRQNAFFASSTKWQRHISLNYRVNVARSVCNYPFTIDNTELENIEDMEEGWKVVQLIASANEHLAKVPINKYISKFEENSKISHITTH